MVEMSVAGIALDAASRSPIVLLRDPSGRRQVPIWIDQAQAQNILTALNRDQPPRPLSHDLMASLVAAGGLTLEKVVIHTIEDNTFRAVLKLVKGEAEGEGKAPGQAIEVDARPSDAIALALRTESPIWMLEEVVVDASIPVNAEADAEDREDFRRFLERTSPAELIRHMSSNRPVDPPPTNGEAEGGNGGEAEGDGPTGGGAAQGDPAG